MILIIAATGRPGSNTLKVANKYLNLATENGIESKVLSLEQLTGITRDETYVEIEQSLLIPATKFLIVSPEYNGSFPGIFKLMVDISDIKQVWHGKKAALTGVATGRAGNLRGMDQLTNVLNHMKVVVLPNKLPLSGVQFLLDETGSIKDDSTLQLMRQQLIELNTL